MCLLSTEIGGVRPLPVVGVELAAVVVNITYEVVALHEIIALFHII